MPTLTTDDAAHLLRRVGFGGTRAEIDALVGMERGDAVDKVLDVSQSPPAVSPSGIEMPAQWGAWTVGLQWWVRRMISTPTPIEDQMVMFWHGHFATQGSKVQSMPCMFQQNATFRSLALGDLHELYQAIAIDPAMLLFLDNAQNVREAPQENFARELLELFTVGIGAYAESDVAALARAWTGHGLVGKTPMGFDASYRFRPELHDSGPKQLFGTVRDWDGPEAITEIVRGSRREASARFITNKLFRWFVHDRPTADHIERLATALSAAGMSTRALVRAILLDPEFWAPSTRYALVKSPVDFVVDVLRRTGLRIEDSGIDWAMHGMGQVPFDPPSVRGWGASEQWLTTSAMSVRGSWLAFLRWGTSAAGFWSGLEQLAPREGVQRILDDLGIDSPSLVTRTALERWFADAQRSAAWTIPADALLVAGMTPEFHVK